MNIVLVRADEWEGVYIDGKCFDQHHSVDLWSLVEHLGGTMIVLNKTQEAWLLDNGELPEQLEDLPK